MTRLSEHSTSDDPSLGACPMPHTLRSGPWRGYSVDSGKSNKLGKARESHGILAGQEHKCTHPLPLPVPTRRNNKHANQRTKRGNPNHSHGTPSRSEATKKGRGDKVPLAGYPRRTRIHETLRRVDVVEPSPRPSLSPPLAAPAPSRVHEDRVWYVPESPPAYSSAPRRLG